MAGDLNVGLHGASSAFEAFRNLTVNRDHNLGTLDVVKNAQGEVTELKCSNHHFWKFWANDSRSVAMESANELRSVFEKAVDVELQKCFDKILKGDEEHKAYGVTKAERDALLGKMKEIKENFHRAIFPEGCEKKAMSFTRKDICAIVQNVDKLVADEELSINVLLAADADDLCKMASDTSVEHDVDILKSSKHYRETLNNAAVAKEAMKHVDTAKILSASGSLVEHISPQLSQRLKAMDIPPFSRLFEASAACKQECVLSKQSSDRKSLTDAMKTMIQELNWVTWPDELTKDAVSELEIAIQDCEAVVQRMDELSAKELAPAERKRLDVEYARKCEARIDKLEKKLTCLKNEFEANVAEQLAPSNEILKKNGISTVCFGLDGKLTIRESVELEGEELAKAVRKDIDSIIDDISDEDSNLRQELAADDFDPETDDSYMDKQLALQDFRDAIDDTHEHVRMDAVAGQMKQQIKSDSTVRFGVYTKTMPVGDEAKKLEDISKHLAKFKTDYADVELGKGGREKYENGYSAFNLNDVRKFVAKKYKGDNEIKVFLDVMSWYSKDSPKLFHSDDEEKEVYRGFLEGVKREVERICDKKSGGCPEGEFKGKLESVMSSCLELSTGIETHVGTIYDRPAYYSDLFDVVEAVGEAMEIFRHSI